MSQRNRRRAVAEINMVPFIDVMLVLLVIFMATAPLIALHEISLPSVSQAPPSQDKPNDALTVTIKSEQSFQLKSQRRGVLAEGESLDDLMATIEAEQAQSASLPIVVAADKDLRYELVIEVMDTLRQRNVQQIGLMVASK